MRMLSALTLSLLLCGCGKGESVVVASKEVDHVLDRYTDPQRRPILYESDLIKEEIKPVEPGNLTPLEKDVISTLRSQRVLAVKILRMHGTNNSLSWNVYTEFKQIGDRNRSFSIDGRPQKWEP